MHHSLDNRLKSVITLIPCILQLTVITTTAATVLQRKLHIQDSEMTWGFGRQANACHSGTNDGGDIWVDDGWTRNHPHPHIPPFVWFHKSQLPRILQVIFGAHMWFWKATTWYSHWHSQWWWCLGWWWLDGEGIWLNAINIISPQVRTIDVVGLLVATHSFW